MFHIPLSLMGADTNCSVMRSPGQNVVKVISIFPLKAGNLQHETPRNQEIKPPLASVKQLLLKEKHRDRASLFKHPSSAPAGATSLAPESQCSVGPSVPGQSRGEQQELQISEPCLPSQPATCDPCHQDTTDCKRVPWEWESTGLLGAHAGFGFSREGK